jgi:hypothetical protein
MLFRRQFSKHFQQKKFLKGGLDSACSLLQEILPPDCTIARQRGAKL